MSSSQMAGTIDSPRAGIDGPAIGYRKGMVAAFTAALKRR